jgi:broad specificity phosphatase PhoE
MAIHYALKSLHALLAVLLLGGCGGGEESPRQPRLVDELQRGGLVLVLRHSTTDTRIEKQELLRSCALQRNLSRAGREQARAVGASIRELEIPIGDVRASPMCRTRDTARLAFGKAELDRRLLSLGVEATEREDARRTAFLRDFVTRPPPAGTNTVLVTHTGNIGRALGESVAEGELLAYRGGELVGRMKADAWPEP